ncbi:MAG: 5-(carboxyamino)imidazole ribonucleotide synthase [Burkholderiales bacterium]|nr:5-(carboxyamino)imidazole ribonucleotide synthase [Burkholderiales bacterium]
MTGIAPGGWLGLLGGGQLGRMFCHAAQSLGYKVVVLDPVAGGPAASVAERHIAADYLDAKGLAELASSALAATTEFENVPAAALDFLANTVRVAPAAASVAIAQDRISEKTFLRGHGFGVAPFAVLRTDADFATLPGDLFPGIVKSARLGYDGKGQVTVTNSGEARAAWRALGHAPCVLEQRVALACEISVVVARDARGTLATWPAAENRHRDGILDVSIAPARVSETLASAAREIATGVVGALGYCGVLCVELFVTRDGALLVNEIAPRPHNSGHYTIDACVTSQFEQQVRVLAGLPLGDTRQHTPAVMVNLLGDVWFANPAATVPREPDWNAVLRHPAAKLHLYGKAQPRRARKMGHVTCLGATLDDALATARAIRRDLGITGTV